MDQGAKMSAAGTTSRPTRTAIAAEQFVPDHVFLHITQGELHIYDGDKDFTLQAGDHYLVRKNRLVRYDKESGIPGCEMIVVCLEEKFLKSFQDKHKLVIKKIAYSDTLVNITKNDILSDFIRSLKHYYDESGRIAEAFAEVKYEELLIILLQNQPELAGIFFDYGSPGKMNLDKFMNKNFQFNVSLQRFAFLTGRSISAFKRDFKEIFNETPSRWLVQKRLQEAYFLLDQHNQKPSEIYFDLGFKNLSHFSFAFKNRFGRAPSELLKKKRTE